MSSIDTIVKNIEINLDNDSISFKKNKLENLSYIDKNSLMYWLYCNIHLDNPDLFKLTNGFNYPDLNEKISKSIDDKGFYVIPEKLEDNYFCLAGVKIKSEKNEDYKIPSFRPNLTPGFFMYINHLKEHNKRGSDTKRFYISSRKPDYSIDIWSKIIFDLRNIGISFSIKILSISSNYPRTDSIVVYVDKKDEKIVEKRITEIIKKGDNLDEHNTSILCKKIYKNLSTSSEPIQNQTKRKSFGEHRCEAIALAIIDTFKTSLNFQETLTYRFQEFGIDCKKIFNNCKKGGS